MTSASANPFCTSPMTTSLRVFGPKKGMPGVTTFPGNSSYNWGAPGFSASSGSKTAGSTSYSTSIRCSASLRVCSVVCRDEGDRVADVADLPVEDAREAGRAALPVGHVLPREHRLDAGKGLGPSFIDVLDDGMGVGTAQHLPVEHAPTS